MMKLTFALMVAAVFGGAVIACAGSDDAVDGSGAAISGSLADARACAVRDAYERAQLSDIANLTVADLPASVRSQLATTDGGEPFFDALGKLRVTGVGDVYIVEEALMLTFLDATGRVLVRADVSGPSDRWRSLTGGVLTCGTVAIDGGVHPLDGGHDGGSVGHSDGGFPSFDAGPIFPGDSGLDAH